MECASCKSEIDQDSFFCDQCGSEIFCCADCGKPGIGKFCENDGAELVSALNQPVGLYKKENKSGEASLQPARPPIFKLINRNINLELDVAPGDLLGRSSGKFASVLSGYKSISGRHMSFDYDPQSGWYAMDIGSTNRIKYSSQNTAWDTVAPSPQHTRVYLQNKHYLLIANLEFYIQIQTDTPGDPNATIRL